MMRLDFETALVSLSMPKLLISALLLLLTSTLFGQTAHMLGMGNTSAARTDDNALFGNQAGLAKLENTSVAISTERRFNLSALNNHNAGAALVSKAGVFGLSLNYFGFSEYNEQKIGLAYARTLSKKFSIGAQVDYLGTRIKEFGNIRTFTFELGLLAALNNKLNLGAHIFNPIGTDRGIEEEPLETILSIGLSYRASNKFNLLFDVQAELDFDPRYKIGLDYALNEILQLRFGAYTEPVTLSFGLGLKIKEQLLLDIASSYQTVLGVSPGLGIRYIINKNKS